MHTATQLSLSMFDLRLDGEQANPLEVFGAWRDGDRLAVVVNAPYGGVGAALYAQSWTAWFYANNPDAVTTRARYADAYLFHIGGRFGDHSYYDYWPPYKELVCDDVVSIFEAVNARRITHLLIPSATRLPADAHFSLANATAEHLRSAVVYDASGRLDGPDLTIQATDPSAHENTLATLEPASIAATLRPEELPTPDLVDWGRRFLERVDEVAEDDRLRALAQYRARTDVPEQYRFVAVPDLLGVRGPRTLDMEDVHARLQAERAGHATGGQGAAAPGF